MRRRTFNAKPVLVVLLVLLALVVLAGGHPIIALLTVGLAVVFALRGSAKATFGRAGK